MSIEKYGVVDVKALQRMELLDVQDRIRKLQAIPDDEGLEKQAQVHGEIRLLQGRADELRRALSTPDQ